MNKRKKVKLRKFFKPLVTLVYEKKRLTHEQRTVYNLTKRFILDSKSTLRIGPLSSSRFIECDNVLIKINQHKVTVYHLDSKIDEEFQYETIEELTKLFDVTAENARIILEWTYLTPVMNKLKKLHK